VPGNLQGLTGTVTLTVDELTASRDDREVLMIAAAAAAAGAAGAVSFSTLSLRVSTT